MPNATAKVLRLINQRAVMIATLLFVVTLQTALHAADNEDFDAYHVKVSVYWFRSSPSGQIEGSADSGAIDLQKDLGFNTYSTVLGKVDWKFTRKNHLYISASPFQQDRTTVLNRTITFQGQTFNVGLTTQSHLQSNFYAPGYQYDILRRKRGHLGVAVQMDLFDASARISAAAQTTGNGMHYQAVSASGSLLAPIPVAGPDWRLYLTNSPRLFLEGNVLGMYLFGYGNFVSTADAIGVSLGKHFSLNAGYALGSRLVVNNSSSSKRIGIHLTQKGAIAGVEASF